MVMKKKNGRKNCLVQEVKWLRGKSSGWIIWVNVAITENNDRNSDVLANELRCQSPQWRRGVMRMLVDGSNKVTSLETSPLAHQVNLYPVKCSHRILYVSSVALSRSVWHLMLISKKAGRCLCYLFLYQQCLPDAWHISSQKFTWTLQGVWKLSCGPHSIMN